MTLKKHYYLILTKILLLDLVSHGHLGAQTQLRFLTGRGVKFCDIYVVERARVIGMSKNAKGWLAFNTFQKQIGVGSL